jgi:hypothetical protein
MTSFSLRLLAIVCMFADHAGVHLPEPWSAPLRMAGRLAMPLFCFLIGEGMRHTADRKKYLFRLGMFALLSEPAFDLFRTGRLVDWGHQNVFFTLLLGAAALWLYEESVKQKRSVMGLYAVLACACLAELIRADYGLFGVAWIVALAFFRGQPHRRAGVFLLITALYSLLMTGVWRMIGLFAGLAVIPVSMYNGQSGFKSRVIQFAFYAFYPLHLLGLYWWAWIR